MEKGQIRKALSGFYYVHSDGELIQCRGRGVFRNRGISPLVGDFVDFVVEGNNDGTITAVHERHNELVRPPVANIDQAILVFSAKEPAFNTILLDKFLVALESFHIHPIICLTKTDLLTSEENEGIQQYVKDYQEIGYEVIQTYKSDPEILVKIEQVLDGKTTVLAGQSGVGKSTLLNTIMPSLELKTGVISEALGRGKHTTRHVELIPLAGGLIADTPGFSSFDFDTLEKEELTSCFPELQRLSEDCKFRGCLHLKEPKCAVKAAIENKEIKQYRYDHYLQFLQEIIDRKPRY
ncbi:ribosome small subunit-dependent GTPase A [Viridibacillus sp. FSL R5-0477]|uniref:Small ribosomal subunit biogenesis GTPase RsgA n=1 Tax=Viridibacillus arenosi FSL R5-213 TaxID=1227360 RepID=W4F0F9_9BACL|nr:MULTISPECIES: ribosome small subunit-dependent GTPase A [Viridibacillus]ETT85812.1 GTPase EngC [Viridibacillus arenosi FSL R5-213]OMC82934.1 ribosome small subunit-dependent GTPase A [Viridibacillus sp. FSL H8-0123]OMC88852.1 ribosome small subunit-dependent GTPase A [Viridibacillus sp. FSL H7-0596]OMC93480.1 ribosome small subunit-dependent GTPase A [Viridibacillus arenosi]